MRIVWLPQARRNLDHQIRYIAERNPLAAVEQDAIVAAAVSRLADFPETGRIGRMRQTRELVIVGTPFLAIYRVHNHLDEVHIHRILHARQKYPPE
jgi:toxin ParE1/3/4